MVVLSVTNCPLQLRGDLTKWLMEINSGLYVGKLSTRVREKIWQRVCDNIKKGQAVLLYTTNNEQGFNILTYNNDWITVDCEGLVLMHKPIKNNACKEMEKLQVGFSKAAKFQMIKNRGRKVNNIYVYLYIQAVNINQLNDTILEVGMQKVVANDILEKYHEFVMIKDENIKSKSIINVLDNNTNIKSYDYIKNMLEEMQSFIGEATVIGYNIKDSVEFIERKCKEYNILFFIKKYKDIMLILKKKLFLDNFTLQSVANYYNIDTGNVNDSLDYCRIIKLVYDKLNKI